MLALWIASASSSKGPAPTAGGAAPAAVAVKLQQSAPAMPVAPVPAELVRFALNALLVPLIDDAEPPRWTDAALDLACGPGTRVLVDGQPLAPNTALPAKAFTVRWTMDRCMPLGTDAVELTGSVELRVFHEDNGLSAVVMPDGLQVDSAQGRTWLQRPFAAAMLLGT